VTQEEAALWTDGRYFLQAEMQLDQHWTLMRYGLKETPNKEEWLRHRLEKHQNIGVDPTLISIGKRGEEGVIVTNISQSLVNVCLFIRGCYEHSKSIGGVFITARIRC
jgi:hypothetical protein